MAFIFAAPTYASPPVAVAPVVIVVARSTSDKIVSISGRAPNRPIPTDSPDVAPATALSRMDVAHAWTLSTLGPSESECLWAIADWESHSQPYVVNASSGAYGLWQIKPVSKLIDWAAANGITEWWLPLAQAQRAAEYAVTRYGGACAATWAHTRTGWW